MFLTLSRIRGYCCILLLATVATVVWLLSGPGIADPLGQPVGTDFVQFWTASWAVLHGRTGEIYSLVRMAALERALLPASGAHGGVYAFLYPPLLLLFIAPLALLPYLAALGVWLAVGLAAYLTALWRILPHRLTLLAGAAFPAVLLVIEHGQTSALVVALLTWGLILRERRPIFAGVLLGCLAIKPQLAVLLPVALLAVRDWRVLGTAAMTAFGLAGVTVLLFGAGIWREFFASAPIVRAVLANGDLSPYFKMQSVFSALRMLGLTLPAAFAVQGICAAGAMACAIWVWRGAAPADVKNALLCAVIPLVTPYFLDYDLLILAPAIAFQIRVALREDFFSWERTILAACFVVPLIARPLARLTHIALAPILILALIAIFGRRILEGSTFFVNKNKQKTSTSAARHRA